MPMSKLITAHHSMRKQKFTRILEGSVRLNLAGAISTVNGQDKPTDSGFTVARDEAGKYTLTVHDTSLKFVHGDVKVILSGTLYSGAQSGVNAYLSDIDTAGEGANDGTITIYTYSDGNPSSTLANPPNNSRLAVRLVMKE